MFQAPPGTLRIPGTDAFGSRHSPNEGGSDAAAGVDGATGVLEAGSIGFTLCRRRRRASRVREGAVAEHSTGARTTPTDRENDLPHQVALAPGYYRRILRLEAMPSNASGADKSWVHRAHADAVRHLNSAKRR